jgi:HSF-type DNA-binding
MDVDMETEVALALVQAGQGGKRNGEDSPDAAGGGFKRIRRSDPDEAVRSVVVAPLAPAAAGPPAPALEEERASETSRPELQPYPYFYYRDYSKEKDPDPLSPLTPPGRVPNFPAKMHAILSRSELSEIVSWMPHGRAWRVLKPREFEVKVVPLFFEHAKFSSFIRQANGWGFRRITQGRDRNCYYHELFLRGLPYLCKMMKRPAVAEKQASDPDQEPDFYRISEELPLPEKAEDETILLNCTVQGGPKARMPIYTGSLLPTVSIALSGSKPPASAASPQLPPRDQTALSGFQAALGASELQLKALSFAGPSGAAASSAAPSPSPPMAPPVAAAAPVAAPPAASTPFAQFTSPMNPVPFLPPSTFLPNSMPLPFQIHGSADARVSPLANASRLAFGAGAFGAGAPAATAPATPPVLPDMAAAQFAAGFAAATALSQQQLRNVLNNFTFIPRTVEQQQQQQQAQPHQLPSHP